jgi:hypothetical protein
MAEPKWSGAFPPDISTFSITVPVPDTTQVPLFTAKPAFVNVVVV